MTAYIYRNILIMERGSTHGVCSLIKNIPGVWFDSTNIGFQHESPLDKVIVFFKPMESNTAILTLVPQDWKPQSPIIGYIKLLSSNTKLKVINCTFTLPELISRELNTFWFYLVESIKMTEVKDITGSNFTLYWDKLASSILTKAMETGLLSDTQTLSHTYTTTDVQTGVPSPVQVTPGLFNTTSSPFTTTTPTSTSFTTPTSTSFTTPTSTSFTPPAPTSSPFTQARTSIPLTATIPASTSFSTTPSALTSSPFTTPASNPFSTTPSALTSSPFTTPASNPFTTTPTPSPFTSKSFIATAPAFGIFNNTTTTCESSKPLFSTNVGNGNFNKGCGFTSIFAKK